MAHTSKQSFGEQAEELAAGFLRRRGYRILHRNYRTRLGEIDLIATERRTVCFVEVKGKRGGDFGPPQSAVTRTKQLHLRRAAKAFLAREQLHDVDCRFDVVTVQPAPDGQGYACELIRDAF